MEISVKGSVTWGEKYFLFHWHVCVCVCVCVCVRDALPSVQGTVLSCVCVCVCVCRRCFAVCTGQYIILYIQAQDKH